MYVFFMFCVYTCLILKELDYVKLIWLILSLKENNLCLDMYTTTTTEPYPTKLIRLHEPNDAIMLYTISYAIMLYTLMNQMMP